MLLSVPLDWKTLLWNILPISQQTIAQKVWFKKVTLIDLFSYRKNCKVVDGKQPISWCPSFVYLFSSVSLQHTTSIRNGDDEHEFSFIWNSELLLCPMGGHCKLLFPFSPFDILPHACFLHFTSCSVMWGGGYSNYVYRQV